MVTLLFPLELFVLDTAIPSKCLSSSLDCLTMSPSRTRQNLGADFHLTWRRSWLSQGVWSWYPRWGTWPWIDGRYRYTRAPLGSKGCYDYPYARWHTSRSSSFSFPQCKWTGRASSLRHSPCGLCCLDPSNVCIRSCIPFSHHNASWLASDTPTHLIPGRLQTILYQISALFVMNKPVNGLTASGSLPSTTGPLRIDPRAIISSSCVNYLLPLVHYVG